MVAALLPLRAEFLFAGGNPRMPRGRCQLWPGTFENSCTKPVQQTLQQAIALLHSFEFGEALSAFHAVESRDPFGSTAILGGSGHDRQPTAMAQPVSPSGYAAREKDREGSVPGRLAVQLYWMWRRGWNMELRRNAKAQ